MEIFILIALSIFMIILTILSIIVFIVLLDENTDKSDVLVFLEIIILMIINTLSIIFQSLIMLKPGG